MRVLVLTNLYPNPYEPNRATFNRQQIGALNEEHPVRVISPISWVTELASVLRQKPRLSGSRRVVCDGIPVEHPRYYYTPKMLRSKYGYFFERSVKLSFHRAVRDFSPDIVFAPWAYPDGWAGVKLGRQAGLPVVIKVHGCDLLWGLERHPGRKKRTIEALRSADGIVAVSQDLASRVVSSGVDTDRVHVIYDGIDTALFHPGPMCEARTRLGLGINEPIVLYIGNLVPVKSVSTLIVACALLDQRGLSFRCVLIGEGPLRTQLQRQVSRAGLNDRVQLLGARPHDQLADWYRACNLFVLPSLSEGVPIVLLEAIATGAPFVASRVGGITEIAGKGCGKLVCPGNVEQLAQAVADHLAASSRQPKALAAELWPRSHDDAAAELAQVFKGILQHASSRTHSVFSS